MRAGHDRPATRHPGTLSFHWGDAHLLTCTRDRWVTLRRDRHRFLTAHTLTGLKTAIEADYRDHPVPRHFDPPGAADYHKPARDDLTPDAGTPGGRQPPPAPAPGTRPRQPRTWDPGPNLLPGAGVFSCRRAPRPATRTRATPDRSAPMTPADPYTLTLKRGTLGMPM